MGMRVIRRPDGTRAAEECECRHQKRADYLLRRARVPNRYEQCTIENFETDFGGADRSLANAKMMATRFVDGYPVMTDDRGLLLTGEMGLGKTHLAVGILKALIVEKSVRGLFYDYQDLLKAIQNSYNPQVATTELQILSPVFSAEVLVLDDLGRQKSTEWVWDTVMLILNTRYNDKRTTIITTNFANRPSALASARSSSSEVIQVKRSSDRKEAERAMREDTLADRITDRMRSRLAEMCVEVNIKGRDFRDNIRKQDPYDAFKY